jgi:hypothetical protein
LDRRVKEKREAVDTYLATACQQRDRLVHATIVGGSIAAALTAAPGLGGTGLTDDLGKIFGLPAWQVICLAAMVCSLVATIATQLNRSKRYEENIARAQGARAALEALDVGIVSGHLDRRQATNRFVKCLEDVAFVDTQKQTEERS